MTNSPDHKTNSLGGIVSGDSIMPNTAIQCDTKLNYRLDMLRQKPPDCDQTAFGFSFSLVRRTIASTELWNNGWKDEILVASPLFHDARMLTAEHPIAAFYSSFGASEMLAIDNVGGGKCRFTRSRLINPFRQCFTV